MRSYLQLICVGAVSVAAVFPSSTFAQGQDSLPTIRASVSDLDLALPRDRKALDRRIWAATMTVCTGSVDPADLLDRCSSETTQSSRRQRDAVMAQHIATRIGGYERLAQPPHLPKVARYRCTQHLDCLACPDAATGGYALVKRAPTISE
jgi:UrcA family protein